MRRPLLAWCAMLVAYLFLAGFILGAICQRRAL